MALLRLLAPEASYKTDKVLITAALAGVRMEASFDHTPEELQNLLPSAKTLVLEMQEDGGAKGSVYLTRSNVVLRFIANSKSDAGLYGETLFETAKVDQWLDFSFNSIEVPAAVIRLHKDKKAEAKPSEVKEAGVREVLSAVSILDGALQETTFLAGQKISIADVAIFCCIADVVEDVPGVTRYASFLRWFLTVLYVPECSKVVKKTQPMIKGLEKGLPQTGAGSSGGATGSSGGGGARISTPVGSLDGPSASLFNRERTVIKDILVIRSVDAIGETATVKGWVRTIREANKGALLFVELNDGSTALSLQIILEEGKTEGYENARPINCGGAGASFAITGILVESPAKGQDVELHATNVNVLGKVYGGENGQVGAKLYPLSKKAHSMEYLRSIAHLRSRTRVMGAVMRIRHAMAYATHKFFNDRDFRYVHTPLITGADCEGAGEQFCVTTLLPEIGPPNLPKTSDGSIDFSKDFFGRRTSLTVSGQLNVETYASGLSDVYTFGPTFRAEKSHTTRHLAEFWMIEPEIAFADLKMDMALAEDYLKYCVWYALTHNQDDLVLLEKIPGGESGLMERLRNVLDNPFQHITYTEAIAILERDMASGQAEFLVTPEWGCDLGSEHERYITEKVFKKPVIVTNYPKDIKAFYMRLDPEGKTVSAMDILVPKIGEIIGGSQREERLDVLEQRCKEMGLEAHAVWWYLELRKYGSMPHAGFGLGFERLILFITGLENIRDVIPFPRYPGHAEF